MRRRHPCCAPEGGAEGGGGGGGGGDPVDLRKTVEALSLRVKEIGDQLKKAPADDQGELRAELKLLRQELAELRSKMPGGAAPPVAGDGGPPPPPKRKTVDDELWGN